MILIIIYTILSFLFDGLIPNYISTNITNPSYFITIYSVISLVITFSYFDNKNKYIYIIIILGFFFDLVYTNTFLLNIFIFLIIYLILNLIDIYIPNNIITINLKALISIFTYHILSYLLLLLVHYHNYPFKLLLITLSRSIIMTIIYTTISHLIIKKLYYKFYPKKLNKLTI